MGETTFEDFQAQATVDGFDEVLEKIYPADAVIPTHSHPFDAQAIVTRGEMWLTYEGATRHLHPGDTFSLPHGLLHDERYGPQGAIYWVARRNSV